jgi:serine phosphatase RsbU (regulator of sigma subunit)
MASNNDFTWNNQPLELPIVVTPPLWMTKYAYAFYLLLIIFSIQLVINFRIRHYKKANRSLTEKSMDKQKLQEQRKILTHINQNLTDSINYATRIQSAMIPTEKVFRKVLPHSFVYFRPRDLVSGDFYWMHERDNKIFVAVVDCTGHGVPGAFMSIIGMDLLKNIVAGQMEDDPARILEKLSLELDQTLRKNDPSFIDSEAIKDGMDMAVCVIDRENKTLSFSGAVNGIYLVKNNELHSYKGDRFAIGRITGGKIPEYTNNVIPIEEDDMVYLFTDGYVDQFGGAEQKKFKYRRFRHLLLNIHKLHPDDQKAILHQKMEEWRGEEEQVDDILVVGFKVLNHSGVV